MRVLQQLSFFLNVVVTFTPLYLHKMSIWRLGLLQNAAETSWACFKVCFNKPNSTWQIHFEVAYETRIQTFISSVLWRRRSPKSAVRVFFFFNYWISEHQKSNMNEFTLLIHETNKYGKIWYETLSSLNIFFYFPKTTIGFVFRRPLWSQSGNNLQSTTSIRWTFRRDLYPLSPT